MECGGFNSRRLKDPASPGWAVWLGHHAGELIIVSQHLQNRNGEVRGTHENDMLPGNHVTILAYFQISLGIGRMEHEIGCFLSEFVVK
jgi:hypothetical protein